MSLLKFLSILTIFTILRFNFSFPLDDTLAYVWPLPSEFTSGSRTLSVDPALSLDLCGGGVRSSIIKDAFERYKRIIFKHCQNFSVLERFRYTRLDYDVRKLKIVVFSGNEELRLGVDESYTLFVDKNYGQSIVGQAVIEANTVYGALRGLETFSQLCTFDYGTKSVRIYKAPWYIRDKPRFAYRGLMLDTSRHYLPIDVIKQIIESMSYAKF